MRGAIVAGLMTVALTGPVLAFDFPPDGFADVFNELAARRGSAARVSLQRCVGAADDRSCRYQLALGALIQAAGGRKTHAVIALWSLKAAGEGTMPEVLTILAQIASPGASDAERSRMIGAVVTSDLAEMTKAHDPVALGGTEYLMRIEMPEFAVVFSAIDTTAP